MEHAVRSGRAVRVDELFADECEDEEAVDEIGLIAGLRFAVPIGLAMWALLIWIVVHFFG
jgi:hypothetical protein